LLLVLKGVTNGGPGKGRGNPHMWVDPGSDTSQFPLSFFFGAGQPRWAAGGAALRDAGAMAVEGGGRRKWAWEGWCR